MCCWSPRSRATIPALLFIGLTFSVLFMGLAANYVARLIHRYHWINYLGLAVIL